MTTFKANRRFPNPITVTDDPKSHTLALQQVIEALNIGQRRTREIGSSYVRVQELVDIGLIEIVSGQLKLTNVGQAAVASTGVAADTIWDADGDLVVGSGADTAARLAVGSSGQVLTVSGGTPTWAAPTAPPMSYSGYTDVTTQAELEAMTATGKYILANDIALTGNWTRLNITFTGRLVSNGKKISGLAHTGIAASYGLFGTLGAGAIIAGIDFTDISIVATDAGANYKGVLAAYQTGETYFINVGLTGTVNANGDRFGGFVGYQSAGVGNFFSCRSLLTMTNTGIRCGAFMGYATVQNRGTNCLSIFSTAIGSGATGFVTEVQTGYVLTSSIDKNEMAWIFRNAF